MHLPVSAWEMDDRPLSSIQNQVQLPINNQLLGAAPTHHQMPSAANQFMALGPQGELSAYHSPNTQPPSIATQTSPVTDQTTGVAN